MPVYAKQPEQIGLKAMKKVHGRSSGNEVQITMVMCASASGNVIPPMVTRGGWTSLTFVNQGLINARESNDVIEFCITFAIEFIFHVLVIVPRLF